MRRIFLSVLIALLITGSIYGVVSATKTMNAEVFTALKAACYGAEDEIEPLMKWIYERMKAHGGHQTWRAVLAALGTGNERLDNTYLESATNFVLQNEYNREFFDRRYSALEFSDCLEYGRELKNLAFIVDMIWHHYDDQPEMQELLASQLEKFAGWAYELTRPDSSAFEADRGVWAYNNTNPNYPPYLRTFWHNGRIRMSGALGYAGCVLGNQAFIDTAKYDLFERPMPDGRNGFLAYFTSASGRMAEGMSYTEYTINGISNFFVALKRLTNGEDNLFAREVVSDFYEKSLHLISPMMSHVTFDDTYETQLMTNPPYRHPARYTFSHAIPYFYHSPEEAAEARDHIQWYVHQYKRLTPDHYAKNPDYNFLYAYNPERRMSGEIIIPEDIAHGTYSDVELTILRRQANSFEEYHNSPILYINHGHSAENTVHKHSDQSSFLMYYKGVQLLTDPGYRSCWRNFDLGKNWLASPFAHNVIMVNPHHEYYKTLELTTAGDVATEEEALQHFWNTYDRDIYPDYAPWNRRVREGNLIYKHFEPIGGSRIGYLETEALNPAHRNFLIRNRDITHLQIELNYDHPQEYYPEDLRDDIINIKRNFYAFGLEGDNGYFLIYDEITSSDHSKTNEFMNQLHYALYPHKYNPESERGSDELTYSERNGVFTYKHFERDDQGEHKIFLHGAMGAAGIFDRNALYTHLDELPQGMYMATSAITFDDNFRPPRWLHRAMRIKTRNRADDKFLTLLIPTDDSDYSPNIIAADYSSGYSMRYHIANDGYYTYAAITNDGSINLPERGVEFKTAADFFMVEAKNGFRDVRQFVIKGDNHLTVETYSKGGMDSRVIFESENDIGEVLARYDRESGRLYVTIKPEQNFPESFYPSYKILRCEVEPENFFGQSYVLTDMDEYYPPYHPEHQGYHDHIRTLTWDDEYFYVNQRYNRERRVD